MQEKLHSVRGVLFDLDGVFWRGADPLPGGPECVAKLREAGLSVRFVSNNSSFDRQGIVDQLNRFGIDAQRDARGDSEVGRGGSVENRRRRTCKSGGA